MDVQTPRREVNAIYFGGVLDGTELSFFLALLWPSTVQIAVIRNKPDTITPIDTMMPIVKLDHNATSSSPKSVTPRIR